MANSDSALELPHGLPARRALRLLGGFELQNLPGGAKIILPGKRERALLAYLALSPKGRQPRRKLAALLWGDNTDQTLLDNLRTCVWRLRKALGDTGHRLLASDDEDIVLDIAGFDIDLLAFRRLAGHSGRADLESAARLCGGDFLDGLELGSEEFESWRRVEASHHLEQTVDVLFRLMRLRTDAGEIELAIDAGAKILRLDPLHEATARQMMKLYAESGRRGAALQLYQTLADALRRDVNTQPEAATRQVSAQIARVEEERTASPVPVDAIPHPAGTNPMNHAPAEPPVVLSQNSRFTSLRRVSLGALTLIVLAALAFYWRLASTPPAATARAPQRAVAANRQGASVRAAPITIAVLAFDNSSDDAAQQSFSDGMSKEISTALAKVPGLQLVAPTSAFQLRRDKSAGLLRMKLGVRYAVEGTVRLAPNRVTVTARLIGTDSGAPIWSQSYERERSDSAARTDITMAIAEALKAPLGLTPQNIDPQSYAQFLRVKPLMRMRYTGVKEATDILEPLVKRNPDFAPAWAALAECYSEIPGFVSPYDTAERHRRIQIYFPMAKEAAHRAIGLDLKLADPFLSLAHMEAFNGRWAAAEDLISKALALEPDSPEALAQQMDIYADVGYRKKALAIAERVRALAPDAVGWKQDAAEIGWENGQTDAAIQVLKSLIDRPSGPTSLSMIYASVGRYKDAADVLETALKHQGVWPQEWLPEFRIAADLLRKAPSKTAFSPDFPRLDHVGFAYLYVGAPEHALDNYEQWIKSGQINGQGLNYVWQASYAPARKTETFKQFARDAGLVAYWRQRGWPDLCRPTGADDFVCD